jgi:hypothetical protein
MIGLEPALIAARTAARASSSVSVAMMSSPNPWRWRRSRRDASSVPFVGSPAFEPAVRFQTTLGPGADVRSGAAGGSSVVVIVFPDGSASAGRATPGRRRN